MFYEVINPSDAISFRCNDRKCATLVLTILGGGAYGGRAFNDSLEEEPDADIPIFLFGGLDEFWATFDSRPIKDALSSSLDEVAFALESVALGGVSERRSFDLAMSAITDESKRETFLAEYNDQKRSSMNDIMGRAHRIAKKMREKSAAA